MALLLKVGVTPARAAEQLQSCVTQGRNIAGSGGGEQVAIHANLYLAWINRAEAELRNVFVDPATWLPLHSEAYWRIRDLRVDSARAIELINDESGRQAERIEGYIARCKKLNQLLGAAPGLLTVLDTHVLLHFEPPAEVNWVEVVGEPLVRLVLPLRVVEELDEKKYAGRSDLADRARRLLSQLRGQLAPNAGPLSPSATASPLRSRSTTSPASAPLTPTRRSSTSAASCVLGANAWSSSPMTPG
jgi:hypothetical protein